MKHAYFVVLPDTHVLDLAGPLQIISTMRELNIADISVECIGPQSQVKTFQGSTISELRPLPARLHPHSVVFVIGAKFNAAMQRSRPWLETSAWLRERTMKVDGDWTVCGVCTGSFLLAQAGLLDGRTCTTHHRFVQQLSRDYPEVNVVEGRVHVRDGKVWTSAGVTAGIDLALQLIADAFGDDAAIQVARENVVSFRRFGSDPELGASLRYRSHCNSKIHAVQDAIAKNLTRSFKFDELAQAMGYSQRHLARVFLAETGITLKSFQTELRIERARRMLTGSKLSLERIAEQCGFQSVQAFRANWDKRENVLPSALRSSRPRARAL
jgi:transcriptional regulator GlxA family with amidase domain